LSPLSTSLSLSRCPNDTPPGPAPSGQYGAPSTGGAGGVAGDPSTRESSAGGAGGRLPPVGAGAGGAPGGEAPLCALPAAPGPDRALDDFRTRHATALTALGFGSPAAWLLYRKTFGAKTTLVALPPVCDAWTHARPERVRGAMGAGFVSVPGDGLGNGFKNPCAAEPPRVAGIGQDAPALP
jgi:hypothetical protein